MKKARGEIKRLLRVISTLQGKVSMASGLFYNDRSQTAFERGQKELRDAFDLCLATTAEYDPESFDPYYDQPKDKNVR